MDCDPVDEAEFSRLYLANQRLQGYNVETAIVMPCPFCAAPDWYTAYIGQDWLNGIALGVPCATCGRTARAIISRRLGYVTDVRIIQTAGEPGPAWGPQYES